MRLSFTSVFCLIVGITLLTPSLKAIGVPSFYDPSASMPVFHNVGDQKLSFCEAKQLAKSTLLEFTVTNLPTDALLVIEKRSTDDAWYDAIGFVSAEEGVNGAFTYNDTESKPGITTYRIVTLQPDGATLTLGAVSLSVKPLTDSPISLVEVSQTDRQWARINVETLAPRTPLSMILSTDQGAILLKRNLVLKAGQNEILIPADHLPQGWLTLAIKYNEQTVHVQHILIGSEPVKD